MVLLDSKKQIFSYHLSIFCFAVIEYMAHLSLFVGNVWSVVHLESSSRVGVIANRFSRMANFSLESRQKKGER